uniref:Choline:ethanolaminephosphotransferase 1 n=1 Tax=Echinococcus granulosus TaxID=6210 RepID=A0A068WKN7_ECHGR|nr:choline:ethanolaminephosphotransferase 1 [Echinococcus granulosus]
MRKGRGNEPLRPEQLQTIKEHKYASRGSSISESYLQVFWCSLVPYIPKRVAPNTLTLTGLIINSVSVLILLYYSPDLKSEVPSWSLVLAALCVFIYQTLDALDGKHARQTNTVTPLGELFDHGCDAVASIFVPLCLCVTVGIGTHPLVVFIQFFTFIALFYMAHWQCYITGYLELDVTEGQIGVMLALLWTAVFGVGFWSNHVPIIGMPLKYIPFLVISAVAIINIYHFFSIISQGGAGKAGTTVANTSVLFPAFPFGLVMFLAIMVAVRSPLQLYTNHLVLFLITFGFVAVKVILKLVVDHMSKSEMTFIDSVLVGPFALFFNQYFNCPIPESFVLWCCCILAVADVLLYSSNVCIQIADYLNIYIFRVDKPPLLLVRQPSQLQQQQLDVNVGSSMPASSVRPSHYQRSKWGPH